MDEFMVSGETIVRDLQLGHGRAPTELGGAMHGRLPPRHVRPRRADAADPAPRRARARGRVARRAVRRRPQTAFWWEAPDGSRVRAEYLYGSYSNGRDLPDDAKQLVARAHGYELELGDAALPGGGMLLMNGTDHLLPQPWLGRVVAEANAIQDDYRFVVTSLPEYLADAADRRACRRWRGELRSGARANVLMGVASNRVDVHQACAAAERGARTPRRAAQRAAPRRPTRYPDALLDIGVAPARAEQRARLVVRVQRRRGRRRGARALPGGAPDRRRRSPARRSHALATDDRRAAGVDRRGEPDRARPRRRRRPSRSRATGPVHLVALDDGTPCPTQVVRDRSAARASRPTSSARRSAGCSR